MPNIPKPDFSGGFNPARQIGMPPQAQPQHNRTPYRPPSAVGAPQGYQGAAGIKRPAADAGLGAGQYVIVIPSLDFIKLMLLGKYKGKP